MKKISEEVKRQIREENLTDPMLIPDICKKYGIRVNTLFKIRRKPKQRIDKLLPYQGKCNHDFFETLETEKPIYWGGFIVGDGYIADSFITINISAMDLKHLETFKSDIETNYNIYISKPKPNKTKNQEFGNCLLHVYSKKIVADLTKYGITHEKSKHCVIPELIPYKKLNHFMRGVFDSDGCFTINKGQASFSVCSSVKSFIEEYRQILMQSCGLYQNKILSNSRGTCFYITYGGNVQVKRIMDYLYKDATVYLERKFKKFQQHYNLPDNYISSLSKTTNAKDHEDNKILTIELF